MSGMGVARNTVVKAATLGLTMLVELYFTKFVIDSLGSDLYGVITLTTNSIMFASILSYVVLASLGRYISIDVYAGETSAANKAFNVAFYSLLFLSVMALIPLFAAISWFSPSLFIVPKGHEAATRFVFASALFSFLVVNMASVLSIGTFIHNRLDLIDILNASKLILSRGSSILLLVLVGGGLYSIGAGLAIASLFGGLASIILWRRMTPELRVSLSFWDRYRFREMSNLAWWLFVRQVGGRAVIYLDLFVVNRLYGATQTGLYGIAFFFPSKLRLLTGTFFGLFNPIIMNRYAKGDIDGMIDITSRAMRVIGIGFGLPVGLLCGLYRPILSLWVGQQHQNLFSLAVILTIHVSVNTSTYILSSILNATNTVKVPGIISIWAACANLLLAIIMGWPSLGLGPAGIALAGAITLTLNNAIFTPCYVGRVLGRSPKRFYQALVPGLVGVVSVTVIGLVSCSLTITQSWSGLLITGMVLSLIYAGFSWILLMERADREWITSQLLYAFSSIKKVGYERQ